MTYDGVESILAAQNRILAFVDFATHKFMLERLDEGGVSSCVGNDSGLGECGFVDAGHRNEPLEPDLNVIEKNSEEEAAFEMF